MSTPTAETPPARPGPGMTVTSKFNADWGAGTVLTVQGERAQVLFTHHPARKPVVVPCKSLVITRAGQWDTAVHAIQHKERASAARSASGAPKKQRSYATTTQDEAVRLFLEKYPDGFAGEAYLKAERNPRWEAHLAFERELGGGKLKELLAAGKVEEIVQHVVQAEQGTGLLSVFDRARLTQVLKGEAEYATQLLSALAEVIAQEAPEEKTFTRYLELFQAAPAKGKTQRAIPWPVATFLPFLASPTGYLFLKPVATQAAAERLKLDLQYQAALNWTTYQRALKLADELQAALAGHGCKDLLDVQAFVWSAGK
jgi:hypothetical protein